MVTKSVPFFVVCCPEGVSSKLRFFAVASAQGEARRLARLQPGKQVYVGRVLTEYYVPMPYDVTVLEHDSENVSTSPQEIVCPIPK